MIIPSFHSTCCCKRVKQSPRRRGHFSDNSGGHWHKIRRANRLCAVRKSSHSTVAWEATCFTASGYVGGDRLSPRTDVRWKWINDSWPQPTFEKLISKKRLYFSAGDPLPTVVDTTGFAPPAFNCESAVALRWTRTETDANRVPISTHVKPRGAWSQLAVTLSKRLCLRPRNGYL